jgi:hypothetical protein
MSVSRVKFETSPFDIGWVKSDQTLDGSCSIGNVNYIDSDNTVQHVMNSSGIGGSCPSENSSNHSFGKYNLMYPSDTNKLIIEETVNTDTVNSSSSTVLHDHYFFANTDKIENLSTGYFIRIKNNNKMLFGKIENGSETILKTFNNLTVKNYRRIEMTYRYQSGEANFRLVVEDTGGTRLMDSRFNDSDPIDKLLPDNADPGYLNAVQYKDITNPNSGSFITGSEDYNYEIYNITVVEERLQIVQDFRRRNRFYTKNNGIAIDLSWTNILEDLEDVVVQRKKNTFPRDYQDGTRIYADSSPISNNEIMISDSPLSDETIYFYAVFSKFFGSWNNVVRKDKNAIVVDTSEIPPIKAIDDFRASDGESIKSDLSWSNPDDEQLGLVRVVRKESGFPSNHQDGQVVYEKSNPEPDNLVEYIDTGLNRNDFYYYVVFVRRTAGSVWNDKVIFSG